MGQTQIRNAKDTVARGIQESYFCGLMRLKNVPRTRLGPEPGSLLEIRECAEGSPIPQGKEAFKSCLFREVARGGHSLTTGTWAML